MKTSFDKKNDHTECRTGVTCITPSIEMIRFSKYAKKEHTFIHVKPWTARDIPCGKRYPSRQAAGKITF